jgi:phosphomannomutase
MHTEMQAKDTLIGADENHRYWVTAPTPRPDGLQVLAMLLNFLSEADAPLSERLAELLK